MIDALSLLTHLSKFEGISRSPGVMKIGLHVGLDVEPRDKFEKS